MEGQMATGYFSGHRVVGDATKRMDPMHPESLEEAKNIINALVREKGQMRLELERLTSENNKLRVEASQAIEESKILRAEKKACLFEKIVKDAEISELRSIVNTVEVFVEKITAIKSKNKSTSKLKIGGGSGE